MSKLIIRRGMVKLAAAEDGPTFEQQFGIMANAQITSQYPKLDQMKLAFQLIDKADDNSSAVGTLVYLVGKSVIFVPAFYRNGKIDTGDMMFLATTQQFLPLSDPWLAWIQSKELPSAGELVPLDTLNAAQQNNAITIREITDPILKTACEAGYAYLRGLVRTAKDLPSILKIDSGESILDTTLKMGKKASETLLDQFVGDTDFLNAALHFYNGNEIDTFAKTAAEMHREVETVKVILPFTKEASELTPEETEVMQRDGYIIKLAAEEHVPSVVFKKSRIRDSFKKISTPGKHQLLLMDGRVKECLVMRDGRCDDFGFGKYVEPAGPTAGLPEGEWSQTPGYNPKRVMADVEGSKGLVAFISQDAKRAAKLPPDVMGMNRQGDDTFKSSDIQGYGVAFNTNSVPTIHYDGYILCPDGTAYRCNFTGYAKGKNWYSDYKSYMVTVSNDSTQKSPIVAEEYLIIPQKSRYVGNTANDSSMLSSKEEDKEIKDNVESKLPFVSWASFEHFLTNYENRHYSKVKVTMHGNDVRISTESTKSNDDTDVLSIKEASLKLVKEYDIEPCVVRGMISDCMKESEYGPASETYLITKQAELRPDEPRDAVLASHTQENIGPVHNYIEMPSVFEQPEQLQKAVTMAAEQGIKDVFDVTTFKLLVRQNRFLEEIQDDIPLFMRVLDSLCRKLFLLYCHTEDFEHQYGTVKLKSLEESLKNTLDSMSDLTIFFKMRTSGTDVADGQDGGELMRGYDL